MRGGIARARITGTLDLDRRARRASFDVALSVELTSLASADAPHDRRRA
ncbi:MAG: hypothetical protein U1F43_11485 [Myxococcota bacterium]